MKVRWSERAKNDLLEIGRYIARDKPRRRESGLKLFGKPHGKRVIILTWAEKSLIGTGKILGS